MPIQPTAHAAAGVLKLLGAAIKASTLYPPSHPGNVRAVEALLGALQAYMEVHGPFRVSVGKQTLSANGAAVEGRVSTDMAYALYGRKLIQFTVLPSVTQPQVVAFVNAVGMDRAKLEESGGVAHLLKESGVADIQVREITLDVDEEEVEVLGLSAFFSLLGRGRLSPQEREKVIEILRSGSAQAGKLLQNIATLAGKVQNGVDEEGQAQQVYQAIKGLDRLILDEPSDQHPSLYANLAEGTLLLDGPLGPRLARVLLAGAGEAEGVQVILDHLSSEQLANVILNSLGEGDVTGQIATALQARTPDPEEAEQILSFLELALPQQGERGSAVSKAVFAELQFPPADGFDEAAAIAQFTEGALAISPQDLERCLGEVSSIDEAGAVRESAKTCVDVLATELAKEELLEVAESLVGYLSWLIERREFALLREIVQQVKALAAVAQGARPEVLKGVLERVTDGPLLESLMTALWEGKATGVEREIQQCAQVLADELIGPLVRLLGTEPRGGMRATLCDLLVRIGPEHVDELGAFVTDQPWYVVRNIASILGQIRAPQGVAHLAPAVQHGDSRVRAQTLNALISIGTDAAQGLIGTFLTDPEEWIRLKSLKAIDARGMRAAMPRLLALLETRDPFTRLFTLRQAAIEAAARLGVRDALPALKKLARARLVFRRRGRELRRLARIAVATIERAPIHDQATPVAADRGNAP